MSDRKRIGVATVTLILEVDTDTWEPSATLAQITKQAEVTAIQRVSAAVRRAGDAPPLDVRLVSVDKVVVRLIEQTP